LDEQLAWQRWARTGAGSGVLVFGSGFGDNFSDSGPNQSTQLC